MINCDTPIVTSPGVIARSKKAPWGYQNHAVFSLFKSYIKLVEHNFVWVVEYVADKFIV